MGIVKNTTLTFEILEPIGNDEGKNSKVFLAKDNQLGAILVVKQITKESLNKLGNRIEDYYNESKALYASRSSYVVEIQYACEDKDNIYLTMPYLKCGSLSKKMDEEYLTVREIIKYSNDILNGLAVIHSKNLVHLDIKPTNILIDDSGRARITDFGLSKFLDVNGLTQQDYSYVFHREPEAYISSSRSVYSDIYQFGVTLYRMCNGNNILNTQLDSLNITSNKLFQQLVMDGEFPVRGMYLPHIQLKLKKIVDKCLKVNPLDRYNNVIEIINDLNNIDDCLDWRYCPNSEYIYCKECSNNKLILVGIKEHNEKYDVICIRRDCNGNNPRKINKYCKNNLNNTSSINEQIKYIIKDIN